MLYRKAHAPLLHREVNRDWWHHVRDDVVCQGGRCFIGDRRLRTASTKAISGYDPKDWLLSHVTIMASVDTEPGPGDVTYPDYWITPETHTFVNHNGDSWQRDMLLASFRSFVGAENYIEHCFLSDTPILLSDGSQKPIQEVQAGDEVISHRGRVRGVLEAKESYFSDPEGIYSIRAYGSPHTLKVTGGHPFYVYNRETGDLGWVKARDLDRKIHCFYRPLGDEVDPYLKDAVRVFPSGLAFKIRSIETEPYTGSVYNLEVEEDHSYIAGGFATHNCQVPALSKGKIIDAVSREVPVLHPHTKEPLVYPDGRPVTSVYVDILVATSRRFEELCRSVTAGEVDSMSMGCLLKFTICTECGKVMYRDADACHHVKFNKGGTHIDIYGKTRRTAELCGHASDPTSCEFVEASWVSIPAFRGAKRRQVLQMDERRFATKLKKAEKQAAERFDSLYTKSRAASVKERLKWENSKVILPRIMELVRYPEL